MPTHRRSRSPFLHLSSHFVGGLALLGGLLGTRGAWAQDATSGQFSVQRFDPAPGPRNFINTRGARVDGKMAYSLGLMADYAYKPFVIVSCESESSCSSGSSSYQTLKVVENLVTADLMGSVNPTPWAQIGLRLPLTWVKGQGVANDGFADPGGLKGFAVGDAELEGKFRFYGQPKDKLVLGAAVYGTGPLGKLTADGKYVGDNSPTAGLRGIVDYQLKDLTLGVNVGGAYRKLGRVGTARVGSELRFGAGARYQVSPILAAVADVYGASRFAKKDNGTNVMEGVVAGVLTPSGSPFVFTLGGGSGLIKGVGSPSIRAFLGFGYVQELRDRDNDGIMDDKDQCVSDPEDLDGFEDSDGCPDFDNDQDGIADSADKCPTSAEDMDGFEDTDGCPDADNDKDGIPDDRDACPMKAETKNGFKDDDGCPDEPDADNDGVPDSKDKCPDVAEDTDGFQDEDGCPDLDNDNDGIPDETDECYLEPETKNGYQDEDGCPDEAPKGFKKPR